MGVAKVLATDHGRADVVFPGHLLLPEIPRGSTDNDWMTVVGRLGWIVLTRDRRIRTRPAELEAYRASGIRSVWMGGKHDHSPHDLAAMFLRHEPRLLQLATRLGAGPWATTMTKNGVRELRMTTGDR